MGACETRIDCGESLLDGCTEGSNEVTDEGNTDGVSERDADGGELDVGETVYTSFPSKSTQTSLPITLDGTSQGKQDESLLCCLPFNGWYVPAGHAIAAHPKGLGVKPFIFRTVHSPFGTVPVNPILSTRSADRLRSPKHSGMDPFISKLLERSTVLRLFFKPQSSSGMDPLKLLP